MFRCGGDQRAVARCRSAPDPAQRPRPAGGGRAVRTHGDPARRYRPVPDGCCTSRSDSAVSPSMERRCARLAATLVGRTLLGALALVERGWRRDDVMAWLAGAPILDNGRPTPATAWDRISRRAGITAGLESWRDHLAGGRDESAESWSDRAQTGVSPPDADLRRAARCCRVPRSTQFVGCIFRGHSWPGWSRPRRPSLGWIGRRGRGECSRHTSVHLRSGSIGRSTRSRRP